MADDYQALLDRIRNEEHPEYGTLSWDGQRRRVTITVKFAAGNGRGTPRDRALRYLAGLTPEEWAVLEIDVVFQAGQPVMARLEADTGVLSSQRLRELSGC